MVWPIQTASEIRVFSLLVKEKRNCCAHYNGQYLLFLLFLNPTLIKEHLKEIRIRLRIGFRIGMQATNTNGKNKTRKTSRSSSCYLLLVVQPLLVVWCKTFASTTMVIEMLTQKVFKEVDWVGSRHYLQLQPYKQLVATSQNADIRLSGTKIGFFCWG